MQNTLHFGCKSMSAGASPFGQRSEPLSAGWKPGLALQVLRSLLTRPAQRKRAPIKECDCVHTLGLPPQQQQNRLHKAVNILLLFLRMLADECHALIGDHDQHGCGV
jgi:hypothetical protein